MKKLIFALTVFLVLGVYSLQAQWKLGVHAGVPVGDEFVKEAFSFNAGADVAYLFGVADVLEVGPMLGYMHYFGDSGEEDGFEWEVDDAQFLPIAASGRVSLGATVFVGADLGYAVGMNDGNDGGFFYRPKLGFGIAAVNIIGSYSGVSMDGGTVSSVNVGIEFGL